MKHFILLAAAFVASHFLMAQTIITNPRHGMSTTSNVKITSIELSDSFTVLMCHTEYSPGHLISIPKETYIQVVNSDEKLFLQKTEGIPMGNRYTMPDSGAVAYRLFFPAIDPKTERIDYGENNRGGSWFIYDISINYTPAPTLVPELLQGTWFLTDGSHMALVSLFENTAVYKNQVWFYGPITQKESNYQIELKNKKQKFNIYLTAFDSLNFMFSETEVPSIKISKTPQEVADFQFSEKPFTSPILKSGTAKFSGFIRDYVSRDGQNTGSVHVNNVITGKQETYLISVDSTGYFSVDIPMNYPEQVFVRMSMLPHTVFLEPGKETFLLFDWALKHSKQFMGEMAAVNASLAQLEKIRYYDHQKIRNEITSMTPDEYKAYCFDVQDKEMKALEEIKQKKNLSPRAIQVKQTDIICNGIENALSYGMNFRSAVRQLEKADSTFNTKIELPELDSSYYSFLNSQLLNNQTLLLSSNFSSLINRLMYLDIFRNRKTISFSTIEMIDQMIEKGTEFTSNELTLIEKIKKQDDPEMKKKQMEFLQKYENQYRNFYQKYNKEISTFSNQPDFVFWYDIETALQEKGLSLTNAEKELIHFAQQNGSREEMLESMNFAKSPEVQAFHSKYQTLTAEIYKSKRQNYREEVMTSVLNITPGFCSDIMYSQDMCRGIVQEFTPVSDTELADIKKHFTTPFLADYIEMQNKATITKIEQSKLKTGYVVNEAPSVESEKLFDTMMEKFRGKVVFVDFWATWCGPCRSGIERMKPLKEKYDGKDIVFVYVSNQTSPETTWKNMIADMHGEHFRLSQDEWNVLSARFGISGIPHYVLVDKQGVVANNNNMPEYNQEEMKKLFDEFIAKE